MPSARADNFRVDFVVRLRVVLTTLVIAHHTAIAYGGEGSWFYREVNEDGSPSSQLLTLFCAVNQSFFMGMFFLLAGYFTPDSLTRKGTKRFLLDRMWRLGLPLLVFGFVVGPLTVALSNVPKNEPVLLGWARMMSRGAFVIGPLWFVWALLLFSLAWMLWKRVEPVVAHGHPMSDDQLPGGPSWLMSACAVGAAALALRQWFPVGDTVMGLQLGYFASYVFLFFLGCRASAGRWLEQVSNAQARTWGWTTVFVVPLLPATAALSGALRGEPVNFSSGLSFAAVLYAFWEPFVAWGFIAVLLWQFRERFNAPSKYWQRLGEDAYGAFVVHAPMLVALSVALSSWRAPPLAKFVAVSMLGTILSFGMSRALRALPRVSRVL
jgi:Acyltransferase family